MAVQITLDDLLSGAPLRVLLKLSLIVFASLVATASVGLLDAYFIGRIDSRALEAFGYSLGPYALLFGLGSALGTGVRTSVGQAIGAGARPTAALLITLSTLTCLPVFAPLGLIGLSLGPQLFAWTGASASTAQQAAHFMAPLWVVAPFIGGAIVVVSAFHGVGDVKTALRLSLLSIPLAAVLDPVLIFGFGPVPALGIFGSGLATAISWAVSTAVGLLLLYRSRWLVSLVGSNPLTAMRPVITVAVPSAVGQGLAPVALALQAAVAGNTGFGVAAFAITTRLFDFVMMAMNSVGVSIHIVASTAFGMGNKTRMAQVITAGVLLSGLAGLGFYGALAGGGSLLARIFSSEAAVASNVKQFLWAGFAGLPFAGAWAAAGAALNAVGRPKSSLFLGAVGHLLPVPFLFYGTQLGGWWGFSLAMAISRCFSGVLAVEVLKRCALIAWPFAPARPATPNADESTVAVAEPLE